MFYTDWQLPAPTSMNVSALSAEKRHTNAAGHVVDSFVSLQQLSDAPTAAHAAAAIEESAGATNAAHAQRQRSAEKEMQHRHCHRARSSSSSLHRSAGCVLRLTPRPALSYKEMEQQLQRRGSGVSDCFHVKSNAPLCAQTGVFLMECVVTRTLAVSPAAAPTAGAAAATAAAAARSAKHPLPPLVIGVCPRHLPWFNLPGEAGHSIGFHVAQRHVVKHGNEDRDEVVVPCDSGSNSGGGGRISEGDIVGCLVNLFQQTLSFTVNQHVVSTQSMPPGCEEGSLYFAVGLARRPQHATDVTVRFYTGSACLRSGTQRQPCFPLAQYVRALAITSVRQGASDDGPARAMTEKSEPRSFVEAIVGGAGVSSSSTTSVREAVRDLRMAAVLRDYFASRGMAHTMRVLDAELDALAPSQSELYAHVAPSKDESTACGEAGNGVAAQKHRASKHPSTHQRASENNAIDRGGLPFMRAPLPEETRAVWHAYADRMANLRRVVLDPPRTTTDSTAQPSATPSSLLLTNMLWKPSLMVALAHCYHGATAHVMAEAEGKEDARTASSASLPFALSPYAWCDASVAPAHLTLCLLTVRQDVRYLLHAHHALEVMWQLVREHLHRARTSCKADHATAPKMHSDEGAEGGANLLWGFAATLDAERVEVVAFTNFFTQLMWSADHTLPSAMVHAHSSRDSKRSAPVTTASRAPLQVKAVEVLAGLAGHIPQRSPHRAGPALSTMRDTVQEARYFNACLRAHQEHLRTAAPSTRDAPSALSGPALTSAHMENALLFLYRQAIVPTSAPSHSAQVRLLQTLCSLHSHTLGTLRHLESLVFSVENSHHHASTEALGCAEMRRSASASIDLLETLLDTVQERFRRLVWRRLAHALEDVAVQLAERLSVWRLATEAATALRAPTPFSTARFRTSAGPQTHNEPIGPCAKAGHPHGEEAEGLRETDNDDANHDGTVTASITASLSSFQAPEPSADDTPERQSSYEEEEEESEDGGAAQFYPSSRAAAEDAARSEPAPHTSRRASPRVSYESLTESLPSLRLLWRRVAARAALQPSQHLVTDLFVQELRASLALAPRVGWRVGERDHLRTSSATAAADDAATAGVDASHTDGVSVKRRLCDCGERSPAHQVVDTMGSAHAPASAVETQWFTEELYLSSVYMKRVLKYLGGR